MKKFDRSRLKKLIAETSQSSLLVTPDLKRLVESSLSRVYEHMMEHETAFISGFRNDPQEREQCTEMAYKNKMEGDPLAINKRRNRDLKATILSMDYGVTRVDGSYIEDFDTPEQMEVKEDTYFVVNLKDDLEFFERMTMLGELFCQDSVLLVPREAKDAYLIGTNYSEFPGIGEKYPVGSLKMGQSAEFMTRVNKRPFTFNEGLATYRGLSRNQRMMVKSIAQKVLKSARPSVKNI